MGKVSGYTWRTPNWVMGYGFNWLGSERDLGFYTKVYLVMGRSVAMKNKDLFCLPTYTEACHERLIHFDKYAETPIVG